MVTDGEIDRFFMALLDWWLSKDQDNPRRQLLEAIRQARKACKLPNLTGSAVVTYGLPIISELFD